METAQQRERRRIRRSTCVPCVNTAQVFTHFSHPALTPAVLSSLFCTQRMNSGGGETLPPPPPCPGGNRKQTLRRAPVSPQPCALRAALSGVQATLPCAIDTTAEAHWIHCQTLSMSPRSVRLFRCFLFKVKNEKSVPFSQDLSTLKIHKTSYRL